MNSYKFFVYQAIAQKIWIGLAMAKRIFTFGYEGLSLDIFIARLRTAGIHAVLDVRANPLSRKPGFSKAALSKALNNAGIVYTHFPELGCPKSVRDRYKIDGNWTAYTRGFLSYIKCQQKAVKKLVSIAESSVSCLVCFETDYTRCHRTYVARAAAKKGEFRVIHLTSQTEIPDAAHRAVA